MPRATRPRRILAGLAATEDARLAEEILRRAAPGVSERWLERGPREDWPLEENLERWVARDLFAPLFWRLPVEALLTLAKPRRYPGETPSLAGLRLLAEDLMGFRYDPERDLLFDIQARGLPRSGDEHLGEEEDDVPPHWLHRRFADHLVQVQLTDEPPPALVVDEVLREHPYWSGTVEEAREKLGEKARKQADSTAGLRRQLRERRDRGQLVISGLLGDYEAAGRLVLYAKALAATAELLGVSPHSLKSVVFIHLAARALAHQARDLDGHPGYGFAPQIPAGTAARESPVQVDLAQCFTHRLLRRLEDPNLLAAFEKLSVHQPEAYRHWSALQDMPLERLRALLLRARASPTALGLPGACDLG